MQTIENFYGATTYSYDQLGRTTNRQIGSYSQSVAYDPLGRVTNVVNPLGNFTNSFVDATGRIASMDSSVGVSSSYGYYGNTGSSGNEDQRLSGITNKVGSSVKSQFGYQYDVVGNITRWSQTQPGAFTDAQAWVNQYDAADQLTAAAISDTVSNTIISNNHYVYDLAGNRLTTQLNSSLSSGSFNNLNQLNALTGGIGLLQLQGTVNKTALVTVNGQPATWLWGTNFTANINATNGTNSFSVVAQDENTNKVTNNYQINIGSLSTNRAFSYDANGNLLSDGIRTFTWDVENRLIQVTQGTNTYNFGYDYAGRRVSEKLNGALIKYSVWDGRTLVQEENATTTVTKQFYDQGEVQGSTNYYYLRDHLGSVRELVDSSGTVQAEYTYDPYGNTISLGGGMSTFHYAGYYEHAGTGLNLTLYRAYDSATGRWLSRDPLQNAERSQGPNLYEYVKNSPVNWYDPSGLQKVCVYRWMTITYYGPNEGAVGQKGDNDNTLGPGDYATDLSPAGSGPRSNNRGYYPDCAQVTVFTKNAISPTGKIGDNGDVAKTTHSGPGYSLDRWTPNPGLTQNGTHGAMVLVCWDDCNSKSKGQRPADAFNWTQNMTLGSFKY